MRTANRNRSELGVSDDPCHQTESAHRTAQRLRVHLDFPYPNDYSRPSSEKPAPICRLGTHRGAPPPVGNVIKKRRKKMRKHKKRKLLRRARHKRKK